MLFLTMETFTQCNLSIFALTIDLHVKDVPFLKEMIGGFLKICIRTG